MADTENLVLEQLRAGQDALRQDVRDLITCVGNVETELGHAQMRLAEQSGRIDRLSARGERIERRLDLITPPPDPDLHGKHKNT